MFRSEMMNAKTIQPLIAVIDDDESVGRSLARFLKASGFHSVVYPSAEGFLVDAKHRRFDCLIVDLQLGGMSGIDLWENLASAGEHIPIILITARDERELDQSVLEGMGANLVRKSDPGEVLLATLRRVTLRPAAGDGLS